MDELDHIRQLAGVYRNPAVATGSNISKTAYEKAVLMRERNIRPGTPEWFQLWFSLPYMTGEPPVRDQ
jgi:hypothetical protein